MSSKVHKQLDFLAVGAWWTYSEEPKTGPHDSPATPQLSKIPGGREDVFADKTIDLKSKRNLMKFLKTVAETETHPQILEQWGNESFQHYLSECFAIPGKLLSTLHALTLSPFGPNQTKVSYALPRVARHLGSIGVFGPGFGAVVPKWGGLAEIAQVGCRACAVGGGVYMLSRELEEIDTNSPEKNTSLLHVKLAGKEDVKTSGMVGLPEDFTKKTSTLDAATFTTREITIVSSALDELFPPTAEGLAPPACSIVVFPAGSLREGEAQLDRPVYLVIHTSDTGECPAGQSKLKRTGTYKLL